MTQIKILEVVSGLGMGGAEKALLGRLKYAPSNYHLKILNIRPEIDALEIEASLNVQKIEKTGILRFIKIFQFLRQSDFDVIIVRTPLDAIRFAMIRKLLRRKIKHLIFEAHSNFASKKLGFNHIIGMAIRLLSKEFEIAIAVSENVKQGILCKGQNNVEVIYMGSDIEIKDEDLSDTRTPHLLYVGRLVDLKRPIWLLQRLNNIKARFNLSDPVLTIVGSGPLESEVKKFIEFNKLEMIVNFVGFQQDLTNYYCSATHLVSCSTNEGLPLTFFEAKLFGLIILATPSGGGNEIFRDEDILLKSFDESEFEEALQEILLAPAPSIDTRKSIQIRSNWMTADSGARQYFSLISDLVSAKRSN